MMKRRFLPIAMVVVMLAAVLAAPVTLGALADQDEEIFANLPVMLDVDEVNGVQPLATINPGDMVDGRVALNIDGGAVVISPEGATVDGEAVGDGLNANGYYIYSVAGTDTAVTNTLTVQCTEDSQFTDRLTIVLQDGLKLSCKTAPVNVGSYAKVKLVLNNNELAATGGSKYFGTYAGIRITQDSDVVLDINGTNKVSSAVSAGILVCNGASLTVNGEAPDALTVESKLSSGKVVPAIGALYVRTGSNYDTGDDKLFQQLVFNGGNITAINNKKCAVIGGGDANTVKDNGKIIINGGSVVADAGSVDSIGLSGNADQETSTIQINGGSVNATMTAPLNKAGAELKQVVVTALDENDKALANAVFAIDGWETRTDDSGKLYLYLPAEKLTGTVTASKGGLDFAGKIEGDDTAGYTATLRQDTGVCSCTQYNITFTLDGQDVVVYTFAGVAEVPLEAEFKPAEDCTKLHGESVSYALQGNVNESVARIEDKKLLVYPAADGQKLQVVATITVNGQTFTTAPAEFAVTKSDDYVLDIAEGNIIIDDDELTVGSNTFERVAGKTIKIVQSGSGTVSNHIVVNDDAELVLNNLNMKKNPKFSTTEELKWRDYALLHIGANAVVQVELVGDNKISTDVGTTNLGIYDQPAVYVHSLAKLTIDGEGALWLKSGGSCPAMGANVIGKYGDIVVNGGRITALGGSGKDSVGAPGIGTLGSADSKNDGNLTINGGLVIAARGANTDDAPRDIKANIVINGGSIATVVGSSTAADICFYDSAKSWPVNTAGERLYRVVLTLEGTPANKAATYTVDAADAVATFTDENGKMYLYLPAGEDYRQLVATVDGVNYYKRLPVQANDDNAATMVKEPKVTVTAFSMPGQIGESQIDNDKHTIKLTVQAGVDISSIVPSVEAAGAEYRPQGAFSADEPQNFADGKAVVYEFCDDKGSLVSYTVTVEQAALAPGEKTVLNVANGDIKMTMKNGKVVLTEGGATILPNDNGYIITGESATSVVDLKGLTVPIVLRDLKLTYTGNGAPFSVYATGTDDIAIALDGVNSITAANGTALYLWGSNNIDFVLQGCGILKLESGNECVYAPDNVDFLVQDGASLFAAAGVKTKQVTNAAGEKLCPLEVTITHKSAANATVYYQDRLFSADEMGQQVKYLTNEAKKLVVYRPIGSYNMAVTVGNDEDNVCRGNVTIENADILSGGKKVTLGVPRVLRLKNLMPESALGSDKWQIEVTGNEYLGGTIVVTATGDDGEKIDATAVQTATNKWIAELKIPNNTKGVAYHYSLSATVDGKKQSPTADTITMLAELAIKTCELSDKDYQVGKAVIDQEAKTIDFVVPYDLDLATTPIQLKMTPTNNAFYDPANAATSIAPFFVTDDDGDGKYIFKQMIGNNSIWADADKVSYTVTLTKQPTPVVTGLEITTKVTYNGGKVQIKLTGDNFGSLLNALHDQQNDSPRADRIEIKVGDNTVSYKPTQTNIAEDSFVAEVNALPNFIDETGADPNAGMVSMYHPIEVYVNGVKQTIGSFADVNDEAVSAAAVQLTVPGQMEMNATVKGLSFGDKLTYTKADSDEIKQTLGYGFDEAVIDSKSETAVGEILVYVPWQTDIDALGNPDVVKRNPNATHTWSAKQKNDTGYTQTLTVTPVKGEAKQYTLTVKRVATKAEQDATIHAISFGEQLVYSDPNSAAADMAEIGFDKAVIDHTKGTIDIKVPWGTKLADLTANVTLGHTLASYTLADVSNDEVTGVQTLTVTAVDGSTKQYSLTVKRVATKAEKDATIHAFEIEEMQNVELGTEPDEKTGLIPITVTMGRGTELTALTPTVTLGHAKATYTPAGEQDFTESGTEPIVYTVTAVDGTQLKYAVSVVQQKKSSHKNSATLVTTEDDREMTAYVTGKEDGNFHPEDMMSRAEAATMLARVHEKFDKAASYPTDYVDVPEGAWYADYVGFLSKQGVVKGNDKGEFMPTADVSRMEFAAMLARFAELAIDADSVSSFKDIEGTWGEKEIMALVNSGVINGYADGTFRPNNNLTRAEAVTMVNRLMKRGTTKQELAALAGVENPFADVDESHWAYNDIISAVTDYDMHIKTETLGSIHDEWVTVTLKNQSEDAE